MHNLHVYATVPSTMATVYSQFYLFSCCNSCYDVADDMNKTCLIKKCINNNVENYTKIMYYPLLIEIKQNEKTVFSHCLQTGRFTMPVWECSQTALTTEKKEQSIMEFWEVSSLEWVKMQSKLTSVFHHYTNQFESANEDEIYSLLKKAIMNEIDSNDILSQLC